MPRMGYLIQPCEASGGPARPDGNLLRRSITPLGRLQAWGNTLVLGLSQSHSWQGVLHSIDVGVCVLPALWHNVCSFAASEGRGVIAPVSRRLAALSGKAVQYPGGILSVR